MLMVSVGLAGPLVMPPTKGALLNSVQRHAAETASGVFHTRRQVGGALAVAVFGALLANQTSFMDGVRTSLTLGCTRRRARRAFGDASGDGQQESRLEDERGHRLLFYRVTTSPGRITTLIELACWRCSLNTLSIWSSGTMLLTRSSSSTSPEVRSA